MQDFEARQIANMLHAMAKAHYRPANGTFVSELERHAETVIGLFCAQDLANTLWAYATMKCQPGKGLMRALEGQTEAIAGTFNAQEVANTLWAYATMGLEPGEGVMRGLEGRAEAVAGTIHAQGVANTLWAYATLGRVPGKGLMRELEGRAEEVAETFNAQGVVNMLWAASVFSTLCASQEERRWVQVVAQRLVSLSKPECFKLDGLHQLHQFFVWCRLEEKQGVGWCRQVLNDVPALPDACREAFVRTEATASATQRQVSQTLVRMGLSVEVEARCPTSGYSIDMLVHDSAVAMGGERSNGGGKWAVEYDGPSHFLASRAPTGATLLKRRHLQLLGHALVSVSYWEWDALGRGVSDESSQCEREREEYLRGKLVAVTPF